MQPAGVESPTALISYSHDSPEHEQRVLELCNRLRARGIDAFIDQFLPGAPSEGWPLWMERRIESSDFTLMICTEAYRRRFMEDESTGVGRGVVWEARILRNLLYEDSERHPRIVPVLLEAGAREFVPTVFRGHFYDIGDERGFEGLVRHLLREPGAEAEALGPLGPQGSRWSAFERPWVVPDAMRTRYFTGRDASLAALRRQLVERHRAALCGLGGIGKTQAALEYAVRHRADYPDGVFWVDAQTAAGRSAGFVEIAKALGLTAATATDDERIVQSALDWLNGTNRWLLVFDNVDDRNDILPFVPRRSEGHVLVTSREPVFAELGVPRALELEDLGDDESVLFLLKRTGRETDPDDERAAASQLARELGNLPLALAQAAAYVAETGASFADYLSAFRKRRVGLLEKAQGLVPHEGVAVTWAANFEAVERASPAAADVLRLSAFLAPDGIPFELFAEAARESDELSLAELLRPLARYSLIRVNAKARTFGVHRLVQEIVRDSLAEDERPALVRRLAGTLGQTFPQATFANWAQAGRLLPHVRSLSDWIDAYNIDLRGSSVLFMNKAGWYLTNRGRVVEAEAMLQRALAIGERAHGPNHPEVAETANNLANTYTRQRRYAEAESLFERALEIWEREYGPQSPRLAAALSNLANLYWDQCRYAEAEPLSKRSLAIRERALGPDHPDVGRTIGNLATAYTEQGRFDEAEQALQRALAINERALGPDSPMVAINANNLGIVYVAQGRYAEAEQIYNRALGIWERVDDLDNPDVAMVLNDLGDVHLRQGRFDEAESLLQRALTMRERLLGADHSSVATCFHNLATLSMKRGRYEEAQSFYERALEIRERALGPNHAQVAYSLTGLGNLHCALARPDEARPHYERALGILERSFGPDGPLAAEALAGLAALHASEGRAGEAHDLYERALAALRRAVPADHPDLAEIGGHVEALRAVKSAQTRA